MAFAAAICRSGGLGFGGLDRDPKDQGKQCKESSHIQNPVKRVSAAARTLVEGLPKRDKGEQANNGGNILASLRHHGEFM